MNGIHLHLTLYGIVCHVHYNKQTEKNLIKTQKIVDI